MTPGSAASLPATARAEATVSLVDLLPGTVAILREVLDDHAHAVLRALGLTDGARLRICRIGDPCIVQVRSTRIGLSRQVAQAVYVEVNGAGQW